MKKNLLTLLINISFLSLSIAQIPANIIKSLSDEGSQGLRAVNYDFGIEKLSVNEFPNIKRSPFVVSGVLKNYGTQNINSFTLNYSINGGLPVSTGFVFLNIPGGSTYEYSHTIDWTPASPGNYLIKVWATDLNNNVDQNHSNDTLIRSIVLSDSIPNVIDLYLNSTPQITTIGTSADGLNSPRDLDFHPDLSRRELWVINKETAATGGTTVTYSNAGAAGFQTSLLRQDGNAWHFMSLPTALAFSDNGNWGSSPGVFDANHSGGLPFTGPTLWSSDPNIYAQPSGGNGSHLDMLHVSPHSMGIAHEKDNVFWVFDSYNQDIVRYDFVDDHGPGNSYHGDGIVRRYPVPVQRINLEIPCHVVLDHETNWLYIVDGGNQQIVRLDITSGVPAGTPSFPTLEPLAEYTQMALITMETVVNTGLVEPSGIDIIDDRMIVSDHSNGDILIYDISSVPATLLGTVQTGNPGIQGIKIGPNGFIWYVNKLSNQVFKVEHGSTSVDEYGAAYDISFYPNPTDGLLKIYSDFNDSGNFIVRVMNTVGQTILKQNANQINDLQIDLTHLPAGVYSISVENPENILITRKIMLK